MAENSWNQKSLLPKLLKKGDASYDAVIDLQEALEDDDKCNIALPDHLGQEKVVLYVLLNTIIKTIANGIFLQYP